MRVLAGLVLALSLTALAPVATAQVPEGGGIQVRDIQMDPVVMKLLSDQAVLSQINSACTRHGGRLSRITMGQNTPKTATYQFDFVGTGSRAHIESVGFLQVTVRLDEDGQTRINMVHNLKLTNSPY